MKKKCIIEGCDRPRKSAGLGKKRTRCNWHYIRKYPPNPNTLREQTNRYKFKKKYGITLKDRDMMILARKGRCDICGEDTKQLGVDPKVIL